MDGEEITPVVTENPSESPRILDLGATTDVLVKGRAVVEIGPEGTSVMIVRTMRGVFAFRNLCPHRDLPLDGALVRGRHVTCPFHSRVYDMVSGSCRTPGKTGSRPLPTYRAWTHRGRLYLALPDPVD